MLKKSVYEFQNIFKFYNDRLESEESTKNRSETYPQFRESPRENRKPDKFGSIECPYYYFSRIRFLRLKLSGKKISFQ
ncbi:hypothetical protein LEP1GSC133_4889 [Leptospira borgpetersenii serovar Pomona str. 200901868]|uniref:Uncharacterized protein n=1 Tax=Leptospira borgpetersenii serovar Pomona str. 200901868 TaxID=1192866 RepID=M6VZ74_LEPBO|nr:hypothetical protein LEP1GSC133_4889 [Leptospira borgpetersenii serovar Pomona str. 200901868]